MLKTNNTEMQNNYRENRVIRVFISSTFRDMQDERDELMKKTFPMLRRKAAEREVTLTELDLRWGITPEESESGKVVEICLREIENSEPFFIGIIGNRYGWVPSQTDLGESLRERFSQVDGYVERRLSVTEMEMQFGVLERPEDMHAYFFIKEQESDDADEPEKLAALKKAVRENGRYPVSTYSSPEDLASQVEEAFAKLLDELFPEGALTDLEKERIGQRAYLNSLCQNYIRTDSNFAAIDEWMADWEKHQLVITGASGLGKSALVANWVKEKLAAEMPYKIIYHFVGNGGSVGNHGHVIKALCDEIRGRYGFDGGGDELKSDEKALEELFNKVAAEGDMPLLIVLDAINQIIDIENSKQLNWLPIPPKNVKILFTTLEDDTTMEVFKNRKYPVFTLQPLTKSQREEMVNGYLGLFSKKLQPYQVDRIVSDKQCENTLVLKTLLDELVNFGIFEKLDEKIESYLGSESVEDFYGILLRGYESDFGESFVKHILSLIAVSRNGLSEEEILSITKETPLHWSQLFCAIHQHLIVKNGLVTFAHSYIRKAVENRYLPGGFENECREEIIAVFQHNRSHRAMDEVPYQLYLLGDPHRLRKYLLDLEVFTYLNGKEADTLGKYWRGMKDSLSDYLPLVETVEAEKRASILSSLSDFTRWFVVDPRLSLVFIVKALPYAKSREMKASVVGRISLSFELAGDYSMALEYQRIALGLLLGLMGENHLEVAESYLFLGNIYYRLHNLYSANTVYNRFALNKALHALDICQRLFGDNHITTALSYSASSIFYGDLDDHQKELEYGLKALEIRRTLLGESHPHVAESYHNIGCIYNGNGDSEIALQYALRALEILLEVYGEKHPDVASVMNAIGLYYEDLGDYSKGLEFVMKSLAVNCSLFGETHPTVKQAYRGVGDFLASHEDYKNAGEYYAKADGIGVEEGVKSVNISDITDSLACEVKAYNASGASRDELEDQLLDLESRLGLFEEAPPSIDLPYSAAGEEYGFLPDQRKELDYKIKVLEIRRRLFGENHPSVADACWNVGEKYIAIQGGKKSDIGLKYQIRAIEIRRRLFGENHPSVADACKSFGTLFLGHLLSEHGKALALKYVIKEYEIRRVLNGENHPDVAEACKRVGGGYLALGDIKNGIDYMNKALEIVKNNGGDKNRIADELMKLGTLCMVNGDRKEAALGFYRQAEEVYNEIGDEKRAKRVSRIIEKQIYG